MNNTSDGRSRDRETRATEGPAVSNLQAIAGIPLPWFITIVAAVLLLVAGANPYTFGVFFKPISEQFGWSRGVLSGAFALRFVVAAALVAPAGYWCDVAGPRRVLLISFVFVGVGFLLTSRVSTLWQMYLVQGIVMGVGGAAPWACLGATVGKWHQTRRVAALSVWALGGGIGSIILPSFAEKLIAAFGWQSATTILGVAVLVVGIAGSLFMKDPSANIRTGIGGNAPKSLFYAWSAFPKVMKLTAFRQMFIMFFLFNMGGWVLLAHLVSYLTDAGITAATAAAMLSVVGIGSLSGRLVTGVIGDRWGAKLDAAGCFVVFAMAVGLLLVTNPESSIVWIIVLLVGIGWGGAMPLVQTLFAEYYGTKRLGAISGVAAIGTMGGAAIGPWLAGFIFDVSKNYMIALMLAAACGLTAFFLALSLRPTTEEIRKTTDVLLE